MLGAVETIIGQEVGGRFTVREKTVAVGTTVVEILNGNPERAGYVVVNTGGVQVQFGWSRPLGSPDAIPLGANGGGISVNVREDFVLPIFPTFAVTASGSTTVRVVEIIRISGQTGQGS